MPIFISSNSLAVLFVKSISLLIFYLLDLSQAKKMEWMLIAVALLCNSPYGFCCSASRGHVVWYVNIYDGSIFIWVVPLSSTLTSLLSLTLSSCWSNLTVMMQLMISFFIWFFFFFSALIYCLFIHFSQHIFLRLCPLFLCSPQRSKETWLFQGRFC